MASLRRRDLPWRTAPSFVGFKGTTIHGGQCGLMLVGCSDGHIVNNDFSFLSGVGLGLYRSSGDIVEYNKIDWCVRGFSYGVYNRGQDSAGILIFELCDNNVFAHNSVTHGGDGFFLWAGQTMMDTGKGGCNGNVLYGNDFSHSPCNAIEATFASNIFANNKLVECWHGIWGGYSFDSKIVANVFGYNGEAISIEHGQNNAIKSNLFFRENCAVHLWADPITDKNWAYPKHHDTMGRDYQILGNLFDKVSDAAVQIKDTKRVVVAGNAFEQCAKAVIESGENPGARIDVGNVAPGDQPPKTISPGGQPISGANDDVAEYLHRFDFPWDPYVDTQKLPKARQLTEPEQRVADGGFSVASLPEGIDPFLKKGSLRGQRYILVDEWGPYDFKSPLLWPREVLHNGAPANMIRRRFEILGPPGKWKLVAHAGVRAMSADSGAVPGFVDVDFPASQAANTKLVLEYIGQATTDYRGVVTPAGKTVRFGYSQFFAPIRWDVKFFGMRRPILGRRRKPLRT